MLLANKFNLRICSAIIFNAIIILHNIPGTSNNGKGACPYYSTNRLQNELICFRSYMDYYCIIAIISVCALSLAYVIIKSSQRPYNQQNTIY